MLPILAILFWNKTMRAYYSTILSFFFLSETALIYEFHQYTLLCRPDSLYQKMFKLLTPVNMLFTHSNFEQNLNTIYVVQHRMIPYCLQFFSKSLVIGFCYDLILMIKNPFQSHHT